MGVLREIEGQVRDVRMKAREKKKAERDYEAVVERAMREEETRRKRGAGGEGGEGGLMGEGGGMGTRGAKRGGGFAGLGKKTGR